MYKKILLSVFLFAFCSLFFSSHVMAQKRYLLRAGMSMSEAIPLKKGEKAIDAIRRLEKDSAPWVLAQPTGKLAKRVRPPHTEQVIDTIGYPDDSGFNVNFGFNHQDVAGFVYWSDAGGNIKEMWWRMYEGTGDIDLATLRVWTSNYGPDADQSLVDGSDSLSGGWIGYYPHVGDGDEEVTPWAAEATGPFRASPTSIGGDPLGTETWLPGGLQVTVTASAWNGIVMGDWYVEPTFNPDEPFIFTLQNDSPAGGANARFELFSFQFPPVANQGIKFYEAPRLSDDWTKGWWVRSYMWGSYVVVEFTTDRAPVISNLTQLPTTLDTGPRTVEATVTDDNPSGGSAGVASVELRYTVNSGAEQMVAMTVVSGDLYEADLPGASAGDEITYWVTATDVNSNVATSGSVTYTIFAKSAEAKFLMALNGLPATGYPSQYYFYDAYDLGRMDYDYDIWAFGPVTAELLDLYDTIIEIATEGPVDDNPVAVKAWLDAGGKNYILAGDEVVGGHYGWPGTPVTIPEGTNPADPFFEYVGMDVYYGDINYAASGDQSDPWPMEAIAGDLIAGDLADTLAARGHTLQYDPDYEVGSSNWLDGFDVDGTVTTAFTAFPRGGSGYDSTVALPTGWYKEDATLGNKIAFYAFDPLSLNTDAGGANYFWYSATPYAPLAKTLVWMGVVVSVERDVAAGVPKKFELAQNYPNPFNPITKIRYSIPTASFVTLKVYNVLGQEVRTLVNAEQEAGTYVAEFSTEKLASGVYLYTLEAGDFIDTKKMMLVK